MEIEDSPSTLVDVLPSKRVRKQVDKDFDTSGQQRASSSNRDTLSSTAHKVTKTNHSNKDKHKSSRNSVVPLVPNVVTPIYIPPSVALSTYDKASQLVLSKDQLICYGCEGGYRMVRATHGVHRGSYYFEVEVLKSDASIQSSDTPVPHLRIGWSTRQGELQAPVGFDQHSFGYRDEAGSKVHKSIRNDHYGESYGPGDVVGCLIALHDDPALNKVAFYKNGVDQGVAFSGVDIPSGIYFPAVSLYMKASVRVNFGPSFIKRPLGMSLGANAVSELQPMNPDDRKMHEQMIAAIRQTRGDTQT